MESSVRNVAPLLLAQNAAYDRSLIIGVDQPWLQTPRALLRNRSKMPSSLDVLLVLYNTAYIRNWDTPDAEELVWEQQGLGASRAGSRVSIADICPSFTAHLNTHFGLSRGSICAIYLEYSRRRPHVCLTG